MCVETWPSNSACTEHSSLSAEHGTRWTSTHSHSFSNGSETSEEKLKFGRIGIDLSLTVWAVLFTLHAALRV